MKQLKYSFLLVLLTIVNMASWAQDSTMTATTTTTTTKEEHTWYMQPWAWVVGGAVLILIIVALTRGSNSRTSGRTDKVIVTKTTSTDTD